MKTLIDVFIDGRDSLALEPPERDGKDHSACDYTFTGQGRLLPANNSAA